MLNDNPFVCKFERVVLKIYIGSDLQYRIRTTLAYRKLSQFKLALKWCQLPNEKCSLIVKATLVFVRNTFNEFPQRAYIIDKVAFSHSYSITTSIYSYLVFYNVYPDRNNAFVDEILMKKLIEWLRMEIYIIYISFVVQILLFDTLCAFRSIYFNFKWRYYEKWHQKFKIWYYYTLYIKKLYRNVIFQLLIEWKLQFHDHFCADNENILSQCLYDTFSLWLIINFNNKL